MGLIDSALTEQNNNKQFQFNFIQPIKKSLLIIVQTYLYIHRKQPTPNNVMKFGEIFHL